MTDTIIKWSGDSRSIKSVPNLAALAPTWEKALELLTGEGLPIDLGPLNPAGLNVRGTDLNKAALLKDETAALYGLDKTATIDDTFGAIFNLMGSKIVVGSYVGNGEAYTEIPLGFHPKLVIVSDGSFYFYYNGNTANNGTTYYGGIATREIYAKYTNEGIEYPIVKILPSGFAVSYFSASLGAGSIKQIIGVYTNSARKSYIYVAIK